MKRRLTILAALLLAPLSTLFAANAPRPNVVLMMADDQGWGETGYNIKAPRTSNVACVTSDILPTVLDFLGLKHPAPQRPIDDNRFKLVTGQGKKGGVRMELFDLAADPKETTDVAAKHRDVVKRMTADWINGSAPSNAA